MRKRVENLPRTGTEYPLMKEHGHNFIPHQKEFEPLSDRSMGQHLVDEYMRNDTDRCVNCGTITYPVVYDFIETSPYYDDSKLGPYIEEKDLIELPNPSDQGNGSINEPYQKRYYFNP